MDDVILRGLLAGGRVKLMAISGKTLVETARQTHGLSRVCTAALGRTLMMTAMMGVQLKNEDERVTAILKGGGAAGNIVCTARPDGTVKGYIENPSIELPPAPDGKLDVALAVGWFGDLTVVRDLSMKEPYTGTVPILSGEIAEDFAYYYTVSEQQPSLVYLGVMVDIESGETLSAGGLVLAPLPDCPEEAIAAMEALAGKIEGISKALVTRELEDVLTEIFEGLKLEFISSEHPAFLCDCSRERLERVLISLGKEELTGMIKEDRGAQLTCQFCNKVYEFDEEALAALRAEIN